MAYKGIISKMITELANPVQYKLPIGGEKVDMNSLLGSNISLTWLNEIHCLHCGKKIKKSFAQGYCYPCFISIPETEDCVLRPELCRAHEGVARDMDWATEHCLQEHYVYLALSSEIKVGVTRKSQIPTRWIDQGAYKIIKLAKTPNRYWAGLIEVELKKHLTDKTNWRNMLLNKVLTNISLIEEKKRIATLLPPVLVEYVDNDDVVIEPCYPIVSMPYKITSCDLEKEPVRGKLNGIKGQYLIFDEGKVINIRKYGGYFVECSVLNTTISPENRLLF
jgi:Protein of unknown function (DUF2797)